MHRLSYGTQIHSRQQKTKKGIMKKSTIEKRNHENIANAFYFCSVCCWGKSPHQTHSEGDANLYLYTYCHAVFLYFGIAILRCTCMYSFLVMLYFLLFFFLFGVLDYRCQLPFCGCHIDFSLFLFFHFNILLIFCAFFNVALHTYKVVVLSLYI